MNSSAAIKAFCGERGGAVCTSSNAEGGLQVGFRQGGEDPFPPRSAPGTEHRVFDGHSVWTGCRSGTRTASSVEMPPADIVGAKVLLWKGHCSVHQRFTPEMVDKVRATYPGIHVIVHPECTREVVQKSDAAGSTEKIIKVVRDAPAGTSWAVGTELHLVNRLAEESRRAGKMVVSLEEPVACAAPCSESRLRICWHRSKTWSRAGWSTGSRFRNGQLTGREWRLTGC